MKILSIDTSTSSLSVCIMDDDEVIGEINLNNGLVHSTTLMPALENLFTILNFDKSELSHIAVSVGPGSFTGIRIGVATANAFSLALNIPVISVSSLDAMAMNFISYEGTVITTIDAQRDTYYVGVYRARDSKIEKITENTIMTDEELEEYIQNCKEKVLLAGEKRQVSSCDNVIFANTHDNYIKSSCVAMLSKELKDENMTFANPVYMRKSQAEIVYDKKKNQGEL
ncbi:tRNA threonylcarbamoyl adenosine modification protein YeaZ [Peptostreptococcaceae bacterium AS15]|nr:tRNA threonylcarbamoyl adenosine modification protein YeaZ [Peptostreptococcaceae bacterium AS15]